MSETIEHFAVQAARNVFNHGRGSSMTEVGHAALDEIERLRKQRDALLAALKKTQGVLATLVDPNSQHVSSLHIFVQARACEEIARTTIAAVESGKVPT